MESQVAVSVIVPMYNAEKSAECCIESLLGQTLQNIEIIVVEDGSTDSTRSLVQKFATRDQRIHLILKERNEGPGAGRNTALEIASGEYVGFVDADDWIEREYFENLYKQGNHADLIVAGYIQEVMNEERNETSVSRRVSMQSGFWDEKGTVVAQAADVDTAKMFAYTWNKLYKRELIKENQITFSKLLLAEDFLFNTCYWDKIESLCIVDYAGYHYIKASKEALTQKFLSNFLDIMDLRYDSIKKLLEGNGVYSGQAREQLANVHIKHAIAGIVRNCSAKANYGLSEQLRRTSELLKRENSREAMKYAKGKSKQEKICNFIFKSKISWLVLIFGKMIYMMQTKSKTAFDKMK